MSHDTRFQYPNSAFKVGHLLEQWVVIVCGRRMVEELRKRPDEELSAHFGREEVCISLCTKCKCSTEHRYCCNGVDRS